ncbi:virion structural protein [Mycobacterium phage Fowlmouth]|uniref:Uncharacterized protein n=1 Tax=Mycobacterium phage Fowlmouth TaxID=2419978 RepID=A0A3G2KG87_9CAUD|nr:virion structural protein [Mycobacterium phage Fowlmouth]AYN57978.1 hypothetical protein SEA_FOWLMOUTH_28 [Mycobacterium phage Fowlmouth]
MAFYLSNAVVTAMLGGGDNQSLAAFIGASPHICIYAGTVPANADTALSSNTKLAELICAATPFSSFTDTGSAARAVFGTISDDTSADATGTATFWRLIKADGTTVVGQGEVGTSGKELTLNTTAITAGSVVSITSGYIELPEGG